MGSGAARSLRELRELNPTVVHFTVMAAGGGGTGIGRDVRCRRCRRAGYHAHPGGNMAGVGARRRLDRLPRLCIQVADALAE